MIMKKNTTMITKIPMTKNNQEGVPEMPENMNETNQAMLFDAIQI